MQIVSTLVSMVILHRTIQIVSTDHSSHTPERSKAPMQIIRSLCSYMISSSASLPPCLHQFSINMYGIET